MLGAERASLRFPTKNIYSLSRMATERDLVITDSITTDFALFTLLFTQLSVRAAQ